MTRRLSRRLKLSIPDVIGRLHLLWWWVFEHSETGDLSNLKAFEIEDVMMWDGEEGELFAALIECGFIDNDNEGCRIHDWFDFSGSIVTRREQMKEAKKRYNDKQKTESFRNDSGINTESFRNPLERIEREERVERIERGDKKDAYAEETDCVRFAAAEAETAKYKTKIGGRVAERREREEARSGLFKGRTRIQ